MATATDPRGLWRCPTLLPVYVFGRPFLYVFFIFFFFIACSCDAVRNGIPNLRSSACQYRGVMIVSDHTGPSLRRPLSVSRSTPPPSCCCRVATRSSGTRGGADRWGSIPTDGEGRDPFGSGHPLPESARTGVRVRCGGCLQMSGGLDHARGGHCDRTNWFDRHTVS